MLVRVTSKLRWAIGSLFHWRRIRWTRRRIVLLAISLVAVAGLAAGIVYWRKTRAPNREIPKLVLLPPLTVSQHWAFQPITDPAVPPVQNAAWVRNPVDHFILARLEREGVQPAPQADPRTLLRRVYLDLIGLPPTPQEVEAFVRDPSPRAYAQVVERLLASPHYGERWGRHWLDLARYADSAGFNHDYSRPHMYRYRDWVIQNLNADLPFDRFIICQLAGDLVPGSTDDDKVATGFLRTGPFNEQFGLDPDEVRNESLLEWTDTVGEVFLGLTMECARCHSHKYDPISAKEYYQFFAFLNSANQAPVYFASEEQKRDVDKLIKEQAPWVKLNAKKELDDADRDGVEQGLRAGGAIWTVLKPAETKSRKGTEFRVLEDASILAHGPDPAQEIYTIEFDMPLAKVTALRLEVLTDDSLPHQGPGRSEYGAFMLTELKLSATDGETGHKKPVRLTNAVSSDEIQDRYKVGSAIDGRDTAEGWSLFTDSWNFNVAHEAVFECKEPVAFAHGGKLTLSLLHLDDGVLNLGRFRVSVTGEPGPFAACEPAVRSLLSIPSAERSAEQKAQLDTFIRRHVKNTVTTYSLRIGGVRNRMEQAYAVAESKKPPTSYVQLGGDFHRQGQEVEPQALAVLPQIPSRRGRLNRLDLARWLVAPRHPLTSRVIVNRVWQQYFGRGLVDTANDFGTRGVPPSHPALLDWLASRFMANHWSLKSLHRMIVTSATYGQSSHARPELEEKDPANRLVARQARLRLDAEIIRDQALQVGGLLNAEIGGPSVFPFQPKGVTSFAARDKWSWRESEGKDRLRRGMYTYLKRTAPHPFLALMDAPEGNRACSCRQRTTTPLQALLMLNDDAMLECARALAARLLEHEPQDLAKQIDQAFLLCLMRPPSDAERETLLRFHEAQLREFQASRGSTPDMVGTEESEPEGPARAATINLCRVILNMDEFLTRE